MLGDVRVTHDLGFATHAAIRGFQPEDETTTDLVDGAGAALLRGHSVSDGDATVMVFRWDRRERNDPLNRGFEMLSIAFQNPRIQQTMELPAPDIRAFYSLGAPDKAQGAFARAITGTILIESWSSSEMRVTVDLEGTMTRWHDRDNPPSQPERVKGTYVLKALDTARLTPWQRGSTAFSR